MTDQEIIELAENSCDEKYDNDVEHYFSNAELVIFARALLSRAIPEGHVVVPKEPTEAMLEAADMLPESFSIGDEWRAMISVLQKNGESHEQKQA